MRHIAVLTGVETTAAFKVLYIMEKNGKPVAVLFRRAKKIETVFEA